MIDIGLTHIALEVNNLEISQRFYQRFAKMALIHQREGVIWLCEPNQQAVVVLLQSKTVLPLLPNAHLGFGLASKAAVDALCDQAKQEGYWISGPDDSGEPLGYWMLMRDPDGHTLEFSFGQQVRATVKDKIANDS